MMGLPSGEGYIVRIICPVGGPYYPSQWGSVVFYGERHEAFIGGPRFIPEGEGIRREVEKFFSQDLMDSLRRADKPRVECWLRHSLTVTDMLPDDGGYDAPKWLKETAGLPPEEAAAKLTALRTADPNAYFRKRAQERAEAERLKAAQDGAGQAEPAAAAVIEASTVSHEAETPTPAVMSMEEKKQKVKIRERLKRATRSKIAADAKDKTNAKAWSDKRVRQLEQAGKL